MKEESPATKAQKPMGSDGPDHVGDSTFFEQLFKPRKQKELKIETRNNTVVGDEENNISPLPRKGSATSLWQWVTSPFASPAQSRDCSLRGGNIFARKSPASSREGSLRGGNLFARKSPAPSREGSLRAGNEFGRRKSEDLLKGIWEWVTPSRDNSAHGGTAFVGAKKPPPQPRSPDASTFQSAMSPMPSRPAERAGASPSALQRLFGATDIDRGV